MKIFASLFSAILALALIGTGIVMAQDNGDRTIDQYACKDVVRESGSLREVAIAFLHGYTLGKTGNTQFNLNALMQQTDSFLDKCIENPNQKAIEIMTSVKK
jgi:hypothetical protein